HAWWIDPGDPDHMVVGNDGGIAITWDGGGTYDFGASLPIGQFYEVSYDFQVPYHICGGAQDNGSWCGPSRRKTGDITNAYWTQVAGGDGFYTQQHRREPWIIFAESQGGNIQRLNMRTGERTVLQKPSWRQKYVMYEDSIMLVRGDTTRPATREQQRLIAALRERQRADSIEDDMRYNWNTPYLLSPHNPDILYIGGSRVLKSTARGDGLQAISPDLSKKQWGKIDTSRTKTGGITRDATGAETYGTVVALAESYVMPGRLMAGTDDGNVWVTTNDGQSWQQIPMSRFPGIAQGDVYVARIEPSHYDANTFYIAFDNHRNNDYTPYLYVTEDFGQSFRSLVNNLPKESPADYVRVIREDPHNRDLLFVGTSRAVYTSLDRGRSWHRFMTGMPTVPIYDLQIHPRDRELIAATHGRAFWIVDIAPLEQMAGSAGSRIVASRAHLFEPAIAFDYGEPPTRGQSMYGIGHKVFEGESPPHGAALVYRIGPGPAMPNGSNGAQGQGRQGRGGPMATLVITDAAGDTVRTLTGPATPGLHRVTWDLRGTATPVRVALSPSQTRDSIALARRIAFVFDSLGRSGSVPQATLDRLRQALLSGNLGGGGGRGGGGGGGGRGGRQGGPPTWNPRPGEGEVVTGRGGRGGGGGAAAALLEDFPGGAEALAALLRPRGAPPFSGRGGAAGEIAQRLQAFTGGAGGGRGGFGGGGGAPLVETGDYLVTLTVFGQTSRQKLRVERKEGWGELSIPAGMFGTPR
ncbi:MAG TPA: hypothetical protein VF178_09775, partial [Gemmatimonadaceae bacterium]